jgi:hypothetical protein
MPAANTASRQHKATNITVELATGDRLTEIRDDWNDLIGRADIQNVFMNPMLVKHASDAYPADKICALLAWRRAGAVPQLAGVWAFAIGRVPQSILPVLVLVAPAMPNGYLATPVIDRCCLDETLEAMLACIAGDARFPSIVVLDAASTDSATMQALSRLLAERRSAFCRFSQSLRPKLASELVGKAYFEKALSGSSRKKLRQHRRRLTERGNLQYRTLTEASAITQAFEDFLLLEMSGWKGRQGTALQKDASDAGFARAMIATLAAPGDASIHMLTLDGRPVSVQIVLRSGPAAFTWKTAYDEGLHDFSPGMLLLEDYTAAFLADDSIVYVDSCAFDDSGYMSAWSERETVEHVWFDARRGRSLRFTILSRLQLAYLAIRNMAKTINRKMAR